MTNESFHSVRVGWTIWGISELGCWLGHRNPTCGSPTGHDAEDCLDAHLACGIKHVVWDLGRSVLAYHSDLPGATCMGLRAMPPGLTYMERAQETIYRERCPLRAALRHAKKNDITLYGRLCMNSHYAPGSPHRSAFAQNHPDWCEAHQNGWLDATRLCYGIPEVRRERIDCLMEAADIGVDGLHLDFCRQPPITGYHPVLVNAFLERHGQDPRTLTTEDGEGFLRWCAFRAESVTALLRELRAELDPFRNRWRRAIPVQVRLPNDGLDANLAAGLDVVTWCEEGLIQELALSELRWHRGFPRWDDGPYIELGRHHGIPVYASSNCLPVQNIPWKDGRNWSGEVNPHGVNPWVLARRALRSLEAGARGIALYQSDTGIQWPGVKEAIASMSDIRQLRAYAERRDILEKHPVTDENALFGIDNHSLEFPRSTETRRE